MSIGRIVVDLLAKTGSFETDINRAAKLADKRAKDIDKAFKAAGAAVGAAMVTAGTVAAVALKNAIDRADELSKAAQKIGVTTEALSSLAYAADMSGASLQTLQGGLARLTKAQSEAAQGNEKLADLFGVLGVKFANTDGTLRKTDEVFRDLADRMSKLPDGADKTAVALELLGRSGGELIPLLNGGADALDEMTSRAQALGLVVDGETGKAAEEFNDRLSDLANMATGLSTALAAELLPNLISLTDSLAEGVRTGGGFKGVAFDIATGLRFVGDTALAAKDSVEFLVNTLLYGANKAGELFLRLQSINPVLSLAGAGELADQYAAAADAARTGMDSAASSAVGRFDFKADLSTPNATSPAASAEGGDTAAIIEGLRKLREEREREAAAAKEAAKAEREAAAALREAQRAQEEIARASDEFNQSLSSLRAEMTGPLAEAQLEHERQQERFKELAEQGKISAEDLAEALALLAEQHSRNVESIESQLTPNEQYLAYLQDELKFLQAGNEEREKMIALRGLDKSATEEQKQAAIDLVAALREEEQAITVLDDFRESFASNFEEVLKGTKSLRDAFKSLVDDIIAQMARMAAQQFTEGLFGAFGTSGGGSSGGFASFFASLFGGGRASGGPIMAGTPYLVGEKGPELIVPHYSGQVIPAGRTAQMMAGGGGAVVNQTINVTGRVDNRTALQIAEESARRQRMASRNL